MKKKSLTLTLPPELIKQFKDHAKARGITASALGAEILVKIIELDEVKEQDNAGNNR
jgi:hypothetical protein